MTFEEALPYLKKGQKMRRKKWGDYHIQLDKDNNANEYIKDEYICSYHPIMADLLADDWHFVVS